MAVVGFSMTIITLILCFSSELNNAETLESTNNGDVLSTLDLQILLENQIRISARFEQLLKHIVKQDEVLVQHKNRITQLEKQLKQISQAKRNEADVQNSESVEKLIQRKPPSGIDILVGPVNTAGLVGDQVILECEGTDGSWISWAEYATGHPNGLPISNNEEILESHPYSSRYQILHDRANRYDLLINDTILGEGGKYRCTDVYVSGANAYAELIMLDADPECSSTIPSNGVLVEGEQYTMECSMTYQGNVAPIMTWTGPTPFDVQSSTTNTTVSSSLTFTATKGMRGDQFNCKTNFTSDGFNQTDSATNAPDYEYIFQDEIVFAYPTSFGSVTYIRWGRTVCEGDAEVIYTGLSAGSVWNRPGGGDDYLCLPDKPEWGTVFDSNSSAYQSKITGVEFYLDPAGTPFSFENNGGVSLQYHDAPCVVCHVTKRSSHVMIPASKNCPDGWTREYWGYLASEYESDVVYTATKKSMVCVDQAPESGGAGTATTGNLCAVEVDCVSMKCPPYVNLWELACAVCTK